MSSIMDQYNKRTALICGISGQDGSYLAKLLLDKGYKVWGTSRDAQAGNFCNLDALGVRGRVEICSMALDDFRCVLQTLNRVEPDEIYNLAGQSSVGLSFDQPVETFGSISIGTINLLEGIRLIKKEMRFYNAGSSDCFGSIGNQPANENTPFYPRSPYAVAKVAAFWQVANYREVYGLYACSGILFNHESPLRSERFVTQKIVQAVYRIAGGSSEQLNLGNMDIQRDWGWAPEYVDAMWRMLQQNEPEDIVIATGETNSLTDFVAETFATAGLDWHDHVINTPSLLRTTDIKVSRADPSRAANILGWQAQNRMREVVQKMTAAAKE